jgi:hypothetical protein
VNLEKLMQAVLTQLELASHVSSTRFDTPNIHHGKASAVAPPRVDAPHILLRARFDGCRTDSQRQAVISDAERELSEIRFSKRAPAHATKEHRLMIGTDPRPAKDAARIWSCSVEHVYRCRKEAKQAPEAVRQRARMTGSQRNPLL